MSHAKQRLQQARAQFEELNAQYANVQAEMHAINTSAGEARQAIAKPANDHVGYLKRLFKSGSKPSEADIGRIKAEIAEHAATTAQAAEIDAAKSQALAELEQKHNDIVTQMRSVAAEIAQANFEVVREEINEQVVPEFVRAREQLRTAYAKVIAASSAHRQMAQTLRDNYGVSGQIFDGVVGPLFNFDIATDAERIKSDFLQRWQ